MVNGNILLDEEGLNLQKVKDNEKRGAVGRFCEMVDEANLEGDKLHYVYDSPCNIYSICFNPENSLCKLIGQRLFSQLQNVFGNVPHPVQNLEDFETKREPRTHGGFKFENCPSSDYVYDKATIIAWHEDWYFEHPDDIDWQKYNSVIWPRYDRTIEILRQELLKAGKNIPFEDKDVCNDFHEQLMKHQDERMRISSSIRIGSAICKANYYHREEELERLEADHGNNHAERIYSIKISLKYQFLSIDKQHGMLEFFDDKGNHQMELRFDGTQNKAGNADHSLQCVEEWKQKFNKR